MALAFDAASSSTPGAGAVSSLTFSHTCTGADLFLTSGAGVADNLVTRVSGVTYNAVAMTLIGRVTGGTTLSAQLYGLIAPATGANNVVWTLSAARRIAAGAQSYTGAHQTTPTGTAATAGTTSTGPATVDVASASGEIVVDSVGHMDSAITLTVDGSQTERYRATTTSATTTNNVRGAGSEEAGATTVTMSWALGASAEWAIVGVGIEPAPAGAAGLVTRKALLGVGI